MYCDAKICWMKDGRMEIHDPSDLRQNLSEELHARAFYDFDGAGRFIRLSILLAMMTVLY